MIFKKTKKQSISYEQEQTSPPAYRANPGKPFLYVSLFLNDVYTITVFALQNIKIYTEPKQFVISPNK